MKSHIICLTIAGLLLACAGTSVLADRDPTFLAHFNGPDPNNYLGDGFYRSASPGEFWPPEAAVVDSSVLTFVPEGKFGGAIEIGATPAQWPVAGHLGPPDGTSYTVEFWWKPNFPRPTENANIPIFEWRSSGNTDRFILSYRRRISQNDEYLNWRVPTGDSAGENTNSTPLLGTINFDDWNYVAVRWQSSHIGVKINERNSSYKAVGTGVGYVSNPSPGALFELKNGIFDEFRIVPVFLGQTELEENRLLGREFEPDENPDDCAQYIALGYELPAGDLNADCRVDLEDFAILVQDWGSCIHPDDPECDAPWN